MNESTPGNLYAEGKLGEAVAAALAEVKQHPTETDHRWLLCELLCFAGELERADKQLETIAQQDPQSMFSVSVFRNLIRAEASRRRFFHKGDPPEIIGDRTPIIDMQLNTVAAAREERWPDAVQTLAAVDDQRVRPSGECDGEPFDDLRDADDMTASVFEALSLEGNYCWIPMDQVQSIDFGEIQRMADVLWRSATLVTKQGFNRQLYLPTLYCNTHESSDDQLRLGRGTDWTGGDATAVRGVGQRIFLVGDQGRPILDISSMKFNNDAS